MAYQLYSSVASTALCVPLFLQIGISTLLLHSSGIRSPTNSLLNSLVKNFIPISPMHIQTSTGNSSRSTALPFFILLSAFFTSSPLAQLLSFFCFQSSMQIFIRTSLRHCNCLLYLTLLFFVHLFTIFISYFVPCFFCLFLSFLLWSPVLSHSTTMSPYLLFVFQMPLPAQF